jgi:hypothetical protein
MEKKIANPSGNSKQRRTFKRQVAGVLNEMGLDQTSVQAIVSHKSAEKANVDVVLDKPKDNPRQPRDKFSEALGIVSFAFTVASWGWSVLAPDTSILFGSALLFVAVVSMLIAVLRLWTLPKMAAGALTIVVLLAFGAFDWYVAVKPQKGKQFKALLVDGYHLTSGCGEIPGASEMPQWMRDQSKEWQARVEQLISEKLDYKASQLWQSAIVIGFRSDEHLNAYQCLWLANKVGALETIVASNYDPTLKHRDYNGPTYWIDAVNGKADISDALNKAMKYTNGQANMYINGGTVKEK